MPQRTIEARKKPKSNLRNPRSNQDDAALGELDEGIEEVAAALARGEIRYGIVAGGASPMPWGQAARGTADLSPNSFLTILPHAGHFVWYEAPGAVMSALKALQAST